MRAVRRISLLLAFLCGPSLVAAVRLVATAGVDAGDCTVAPCATFTYAIGQAVNGDTIDVGPGSFNNGGTAIVVNKSLTVTGENAGVDARTRFPPAESFLSVPVSLTADNIVFDGFFVNCQACPGTGAGITTSPLASGYSVLNNIVSGNPVGIFFGSNGAMPSVLRFNRIAGNLNMLGPPPLGALPGTGVYAETLTNAAIDQNSFGNHTSDHVLIAASASAKADVDITNNAFVLNAIDDGPAIVLLNNDGTLVSGNAITGGGPSPVGHITAGGGCSNIVISNNSVMNSLLGVAIRVSTFIGFTQNGLVTVTGNTILNNQIGVFTGPGNAQPVELHGNRIVNNGFDTFQSGSTPPLHAQNNWWGCNGGPSVCGSTAANGVYQPWTVLTISATPQTITTLQTSSVVADLNHVSDNSSFPVIGAPDGLLITFLVNGVGGSVSPVFVNTAGGIAATTYTPGSTAGLVTVSAVLDDESAPVTIVVQAASAADAPALSLPMLAFLALSLGAAALFVLRR